MSHVPDVTEQNTVASVPMELMFGKTARTNAYVTSALKGEREKRPNKPT